MLMDLFFDSVDIHAKRRAHFNVFMADVHERIGTARDRIKSGKLKEGDPIAIVAHVLAAERGFYVSTSSPSPTSPTR